MRFEAGQEIQITYDPVWQRFGQVGRVFSSAVMKHICGGRCGNPRCGVARGLDAQIIVLEDGASGMWPISWMRKHPFEEDRPAQDVSRTIEESIAA